MDERLHDHVLIGDLPNTTDSNLKARMHTGQALSPYMVKAVLEQNGISAAVGLVGSGPNILINFLAGDSEEIEPVDIASGPILASAAQTLALLIARHQ